MDDIFVYCYRFLLELYLSTKADLSIDYEAARRFATDNLQSFSPDAMRQIEFASKDMPIGILKKLINHENIESIKDFNSTIDKATSLQQQWATELETRAKEVAFLKENLEKYQIAYNFVGLYQGFNDLTEHKILEKKGILKYLRILGAVIVLPVASEIFFIVQHIEAVEKMKGSLLLLLVPTISLIAILIYYFRILLVNYSSINSQLLQLELRKTLCRFIQNYVDYSTEIKKKDKESLIKFENVIFSGLVSNDEKLPSTFDGIEQLTALIKSVKSG